MCYVIPDDNFTSQPCQFSSPCFLGLLLSFVGYARRAAEPTDWLHPNLSPQIGLEVSLATKDVGDSSAERETKDERSEKKSTCLLREAVLMKD